MLNLCNKLVSELEMGKRVFLALVVESSGGSPGTPCNVLMLTEQGEQSGTIGGGCMEQGLVKIAQEALQQKSYSTRLSRLEHQNTGKQDASGLICGGRQTNLLAVLDSSHLAVVRKMAENFTQDRLGVLIISAETWVFEEGRQASKSVWLEQSSHWQVYLSTQNRKRVAIFGGGHCGAALARQMLRLGFQVTLIEPRVDLFTLDNIQQVTVLNTYTFAAGAALIHCPEISFAVVLTPSAQQDINALTGILNYPFPFIGVMGSRAKIEMIRQSIQALGFGDDCWQRISAPVGLPIASDTAEEIAVSISAQILLESRKRGLR